MRRRDEVVLWPVYFDSTRTRNEGRRVPRKLARPSPTLGMLEKAVKSLGFQYRTVLGAAHPCLPWKKTGLILVKKVKGKNEILKDVATALSRLSV